MTRSANEIETLARKAAMGAGFPPAQAESFGRAAVFHLADGGDAEPLSQALADPVDSPILRLPLLVEDVARAVALAGPVVTLSLQKGDAALAPAYMRLLPFVLRHVAVTPAEDGPARVTVEADPATRASTVLPARIAIRDALYLQMTRLSARTLVPASDASRSAGAGAGEIDND